MTHRSVFVKTVATEVFSRRITTIEGPEGPERVATDRHFVVGNGQDALEIHLGEQRLIATSAPGVLVQRGEVHPPRFYQGRNPWGVFPTPMTKIGSVEKLTTIDASQWSEDAERLLPSMQTRFWCNAPFSGRLFRVREHSMNDFDFWENPCVSMAVEFVLEDLQRRREPQTVLLPHIVGASTKTRMVEEGEQLCNVRKVPQYLATCCRAVRDGVTVPGDEGARDLYIPLRLLSRANWGYALWEVPQFGTLPAVPFAEGARNYGVEVRSARAAAEHQS